MAKRVDGNQREIVLALRERGFSVECIHEIGKGAPDLIVGYAGRNYLLELKDPNKPPSARRLTDDEKKWHEGWKGQVAVVETITDVIDIILQRK